MRHTLLFILTLVLLNFAPVRAQRLLEENGLLYSTEDLEKLNEKARQAIEKYNSRSDTGKRYYSRWQARGSRYNISASKRKVNQLKVLRKSLENGLSEQEFLRLSKRFRVVAEPDITLLYEEYNFHSDTGNSRITTISPLYSVCHDEFMGNESGPQAFQPGWRGVSAELDSYEDNLENTYNFSVIFLKSPFQQTPLPKLVGRKLEYSYVLLDTSSKLFLEKHYYGFDTGWYKNFPITKSLWKQLKFPQLYANPDSLSEVIKASPELLLLLKQAADELIANYTSVFIMEELAQNLLPPETELALRQRRFIDPPCTSNDTKYFFHNLRIAQLAAETHNLSTFLKANIKLLGAWDPHFDFGEDRWQLGNLPELEALTAINLSDLFLALALETRDGKEMHFDPEAYFLGVLLAQIKGIAGFEDSILEMIFLPELDNLNRKNLLAIYEYYLDKKEDRKYAHKKLRELKKRRNELPAEFRQVVEDIVLD